MTLAEMKEKILPVLKRSGVEYAGVFGSVARGETSSESDIDILVRFNRDISLLDHIGVAQELEDMLGQKVDLITERSLSKYVVPNVKKDIKILYGQGQRSDLL